MKKYVLFASAILAFASCASDSFTGTDEAGRQAQGEKAITFGFDVPTATRADNTGLAAATALGNQFIVYGEKSETSDGAAPVTNGSSTHQLVFQNYQVNYTDGSSYTTTSNTKGWEYVGYAHSSDYVSHITTSTTDVQTIKYWDYSASNYVFTAFSAKQADLTSGAVSVTKVTAKTTDNQVYDKGYTVTLTAAADPTKLYFSDRQVIAQGTGSNRETANAYGGNVTLKFRNGISQIRVAMYEDIPGHSVTIDKFYYVDNATPIFANSGTGAMITEGTDKFYANVPNLTTDKDATLTVTYYNTGARLNQPKIDVTGTANNYLALGGADASSTGLKANVVLATTVTTPTYNETSGAYTPVFPQESNDKTLKLKIDYTLTAPVTGETIHVKGATAEIPAEYLQWKPNFKYTYIFKISDNTNGHTGDGSDPAGLYPITFDAVEVIAEDGQAEYITTVSEPTITTFGVNSSTGKYVYGGSEYAAGSDIYATIMEGSSVVTPVEGDGDGKVNYYSVAYKAGATDAEKAEKPITEASVAESIAEVAASHTANPLIVCTKNNALGAPVTSVPTEDGLTVTQDAVKFEALPAGIYAIEYEASTAWTGTYKKVYKVIRVQ